jgi:hypothetical protein
MKMSASDWDSVLTLVIAFLSFVIALTALAVAIWQARRTARLTLNAHQIEVIAHAFREIRSPQFLAHYKRVLASPRTERLAAGFESLPRRRKESAYAVCYFFEHLGVLVTRQLIPGEVLITTMRTLIVRSWDALEPAIEAELEFRAKTYPKEAGRDFLPHFRQLVKMARIQQDDRSVR